MSSGNGNEVSFCKGKIVLHHPIPELTLTFSLSCPAIEGDDHTMPHLKWTVYELIGINMLNANDCTITTLKTFITFFKTIHYI